MLGTAEVWRIDQRRIETRQAHRIVDSVSILQRDETKRGKEDDCTHYGTENDATTGP